jgi:hypothetical protein
MRLSSLISCTPLLACIACAGSMPTSGTQLSVTTLEGQPRDAWIAEFFELDEGDLFLRMHGSPEAGPAQAGFERWSNAYVLSPSGQVKQRLETPPWSVYARIVKYRNAFAVLRPVGACPPRCDSSVSQSMQILAYAGIADEHPVLLYQTRPGVHTTHMVSSPDGRSLYVMEASLHDHKLTRIDSRGQIVWQKATGWIEGSSFVPTNDGVAYVKDARRLEALDHDGRVRWETRLAANANGARGEAVFSPAGFITLPVSTVDGQRLAGFDADTGELMFDITVQRYAYAAGTADGLLLAGAMLGQPYVGMLGRDGKFSWLRRYAPDEQISDVQGAVVTRADRLLLISRNRSATAHKLTSVVATDVAAQALGSIRGRCLESEWSQAVEHAAKLHAFGIRVSPPEAAELSRNDGSCSEREAHFVAFMRDLLAALPADRTTQDLRQEIVVQLAPAGEPLQLENYSGTRQGHPSARVKVSFVSSYDRAAEFANVMATQVWPHLAEMRMLDQEFTQITGAYYMLNETNPDQDYRKVFAALEAAALAVNASVVSMPREILADYRSAPGRHWAFLLQSDGVWAGELYPAAEADRAFLATVKRIRDAR